jgi:nucleotide-binding universal stress UspA family protein
MPDIVVGVDGSEDSERALRWAVTEGRARDACVRAVLVWTAAGPPRVESPPPPPTSPEHPRWVAERMLDRIVDKVLADVPAARIDARTMFGPPVSSLLAASDGAEMLVLGARGWSPVTRTLAGSVSLACTHGAAVPVVVVHEPPRHSHGPFRDIVVGVDGSDASMDALRWAVREATLRYAPLRIVHVSSAGAEAGPASPVAGERRPAGHVPIMAAARAETDRRPSLEATGDVLFGHVAGHLIEAAATAQLLVVGARGGGGFTGLLLGSVSSQCVMYAPCPVAVIR